jgi:hypothetical protein
MTTLTNGVVKYERTVKTGDYENKKLSIELSFNIEEGAAADPALIIDQAIDLVHTKLGLQVAKPRPTPNIADAAAKVDAAVKQMKDATADTKAADDAKAAFAAKTEKDAKAKTAKEAKAAADAAKQQIQAQPEDRKPAEITEDFVDMGDDDLMSGEEPEITDKDLQDKITARNGVIKSAVSIKKLIGKYAPTAGQIPQVQRKKFLEELAVLQPAV